MMDIGVREIEVMVNFKIRDSKIVFILTFCYMDFVVLKRIVWMIWFYVK